jgi:hypothetical protein
MACSISVRADLALDLQRAQGRGSGVDLHLHRRGVREGVDGQRMK